MRTQPQWGKAWENFTWPSGKVQNTSVCILSFDIPNEIHPPILFYYRLTNFYQNHRRYVRSVDIEQLKGSARSASDISSGDCSPLDVVDGKPYYPCGLIANSMFNDTFTNLNATNPSQNENSPSVYNMTTDGISWAHEGDLYGKTNYKPSDVVPPPNWQDQFVNGTYDSMSELPNLHTWEAFQVWMRTAGLPTFSKLAQRNDNDILRAGTYRLKIYDRKSAHGARQLRPPFAHMSLGFPVQAYSGTKSILISTRTVMGGKNPFLGIAYIVVGGLCILLGALFLATHLIKPRSVVRYPSARSSRLLTFIQKTRRPHLPDLEQRSAQYSNDYRAIRWSIVAGIATTPLLPNCLVLSCFSSCAILLIVPIHEQDLGAGDCMDITRLRQPGVMVFERETGT